MPEKRCEALIGELLPAERIIGIAPMKKGLTNDSFRVETDCGVYVLRLNGIGTEALVDRRAEEATYEVIGAHGFGEEVLRISAAEGYKLAKYLPDARTVDPLRWGEVGLAMAELRRLHTAGLSVPHACSICDEIRRYESRLREAHMSPGGGLTERARVSIRHFIERHGKKAVLTHIDAIPDNFLLDRENGVTLIDWEYAAMADPDWDLAMFAVYAGYGEDETKRLLSLYTEQAETDLPEASVYKIYAMMALAGCLWGMWCTYKRSLGVVFRSYEARQYAYARTFGAKVLAYLGEYDA